MSKDPEECRAMCQGILAGLSHEGLLEATEVLCEIAEYYRKPRVPIEPPPKIPAVKAVAGKRYIRPEFHATDEDEENL